MKTQTLQQQARITRGAEIASRSGQIVRVDDTTYTVRSQSSDRIYEVIHTEAGWVCSCPDSMYRGVCCKHAHAVEISGRMRKVVEEAITATKTIRGADLNQCKFCSSDRIVRDGTKTLKRGRVQRFKCMDCLRRFIQNLGFEGKHAGPEQITTAVELVFSGLSTRKTATALKKMKVKTSHQTVLNWAEEYGRMMESYMDKVRPHVGEAWRTDEIYMSIRGNRRYLFAMLDSETRYWIAKQVAEHKGTDDVRPMFQAAKNVAGKIPSRLISDGAANFGEAHRDLYAPKNYLWKDSEHVSHIHMAGDRNNNQMESFNGNTVRLREDVIRGLKKDDSAILAGLRVYHNFVRPHLGLPDQMTPGEAAGIAIQGENKILAMIQAAVRAGG